MERKQRKLFPTETTTNQTQDCSYNCYTYTNFYFSPPPPSISSYSSQQVNHIPSYFIILISLFTVIFVGVGIYVIKVKCYATLCGWRFNGSNNPSQSDNNTEDEFLNENQVDHPVWLITTVGLQQSIINSITVCKYRKDEGLIEGTECSVCLNEFHEGETLRLLPKCNHAFHIPCIDTWLRSHTNCPLCRAGIVSNNVNSEIAMSNLDSMGEENSNLGRNQETQMENSRNDVGLSNDVVMELESSGGIGEASEEVESSDEINSKEELNVERYHVSIDANLGGGSCHSADLTNSCFTEPEIHLIDRIHDTELHGVNPLKQDGDDSKTCKSMRCSSSVEECLQISPVSMKRSFSCSGRILSTRGYMSQNSTLPH